jgi:hypothetical protein
VTILSVIQDAATVIAMDVPTLVYGSTQREHVEIGALANTMAKRIARDYDWQLFKTLQTETGDDATTAFDLPSDFQWMPKESQIWASSMSAPLHHITDSNEWLGLSITSPGLIINSWILLGGQIIIKPALATGVTANYYYQSNLIVAPNSGSNKVAFTADTDTYRLDEELLKLGIIWQWKANKGAPYAEDMENFEDLKAKLMSNDKGPRKIKVGRPTLARGIDMAYPQTIPG